MLKALVPVDGSRTSLHAVEHVIKLVKGREPLAVLLVNVQVPPDSWEVQSFLKDSEVAALQDGQGNAALDTAGALLDAAGIAYDRCVLRGEIAPSIVAKAHEAGCDKIIMGARGESLLEEILIGSVTQAVIRCTDIPVTVVK